MAEKYLVRVEGDDFEVEVRRENGTTEARFGPDEDWRAVHLQPVGDTGLHVMMLDNQPVELYLDRRRGGAQVTIGRHQFDIDVERWQPGGRRRSAQAAGADGIARILAPMTGSVVEVRCAPGDEVAEGDVVMIIESMKMNNELRAPVMGVVEEVPMVAGQRVQAGELLVSIKPSEG